MPKVLIRKWLDTTAEAAGWVILSAALVLWGGGRISDPYGLALVLVAATLLGGAALVRRVRVGRDGVEVDTK